MNFLLEQLYQQDVDPMTKLTVSNHKQSTECCKERKKEELYTPRTMSVMVSVTLSSPADE